MQLNYISFEEKAIKAAAINEKVKEAKQIIKNAFNDGALVLYILAMDTLKDTAEDFVEFEIIKTHRGKDWAYLITPYTGCKFFPDLESVTHHITHNYIRIFVFVTPEKLSGTHMKVVV